MSELVIVVCAPLVARCEELTRPTADRESAVRARFEEARALLEPAGLWAREPVVVLDAPLAGAVATTFAVGAGRDLVPHHDRPAIVFGTSAGRVPDLDVVLHESTHLWLRAAGADDARWQVIDGRANHESALVHEGIADFVAAALTADPVIGEGLGSGTSLRVEVRCPEGLTGSPHADSLVVSGALWELGGAGRDPVAMAEVLTALRGAAVDGGASVERFHVALKEALSREEGQGSRGLAVRWGELAGARGLSRCGEPIAVAARPVSARVGDFLAAGPWQFSGETRGRGEQGQAESGPVGGGPLRFTARVAGADTAKVTARSSEAGALKVDWRALGTRGEELGSGTAPLMGWPSQWARVQMPVGSETLEFTFVPHITVVSAGAAPPHLRQDVTYNDVWLTPEVHTTSEVAAPTRGSGCALEMSVFGTELMLALGLAWVARLSGLQRLSRARTSASGRSQNDSQGTANNERADKPRR